MKISKKDLKLIKKMPLDIHRNSAIAFGFAIDNKQSRKKDLKIQRARMKQILGRK